MWIKDFKGRLVNLNRAGRIEIFKNGRDCFCVRAVRKDDIYILGEMKTQKEAQKFIDDLAVKIH